MEISIVICVLIGVLCALGGSDVFMCGVGLCFRDSALLGRLALFYAVGRCIVMSLPLYGLCGTLLLSMVIK